MRGIPLHERAAHVLAHRGMAREIGQGGRGALANQLLASARIEPAEQRDKLAIRACDDRVLQHRRTGREHADAQGPDIHPGAGRELEILRQAAVEHHAARGVVLIGEAHRIARHVEAFRVERRRGQVGPLPVTGRDVRSAHADFQFAAARHQLHLDARRGDADIAGAVEQEMRRGRERRGFGRAPGRRHRDAVAGRADRNGFETLPQILRQRGAGVEDQPQLREERARESLIAFEMRQQRGVAGRHVEIDGGRDFAEVAHGLSDHGGQRTPAVDRKRAGVAQHHVEVVVAAERVVPRQPVDQASAAAR